MVLLLLGGGKRAVRLVLPHTFCAEPRNKLFNVFARRPSIRRNICLQGNESVLLKLLQVRILYSIMIPLQTDRAIILQAKLGQTFAHHWTSSHFRVPPVVLRALLRRTTPVWLSCTLTSVRGHLFGIGENLSFFCGLSQKHSFDGVALRVPCSDAIHRPANDQHLRVPSWQNRYRYANDHFTRLADRLRYSCHILM